jgi:hypothetical protein
VVTVQHGDLPPLDLRAASENLRGPVANRFDLVLARAHRLLGLPGAGGDAAPRVSVDQQGQPDTAIDGRKRWQHLIADVGDPLIDG